MNGIIFQQFEYFLEMEINSMTYKIQHQTFLHLAKLPISESYADIPFHLTPYTLSLLQIQSTQSNSEY